MGNSESSEPTPQVLTEKSQKLKTFLESHYVNSRALVDSKDTDEPSREAHWATGTKYIRYHGRIDSGSTGEVHHVLFLFLMRSLTVDLQYRQEESTE
jgi:hypothetical protein